MRDTLRITVDGRSRDSPAPGLHPADARVRARVQVWRPGNICLGHGDMGSTAHRRPTPEGQGRLHWQGLRHRAALACRSDSASTFRETGAPLQRPRPVEPPRDVANRTRRTRLAGLLLSHSGPWRPRRAPVSQEHPGAPAAESVRYAHGDGGIRAGRVVPRQMGAPSARESSPPTQLEGNPAQAVVESPEVADRSTGPRRIISLDESQGGEASGRPVSRQLELKPTREPPPHRPGRRHPFAGGPLSDGSEGRYGFPVPSETLADSAQVPNWKPPHETGMDTEQPVPNSPPQPPAPGRAGDPGLRPTHARRRLKCGWSATPSG